MEGFCVYVNQILKENVSDLCITRVVIVEKE